MEFGVLLSAYSHNVKNVRVGLSYHLAYQALALRRAVEYFVTHRAEVAEMGRNAASVARSLFTWENVTASHLRIYSSLWPNDGAC